MNCETSFLTPPLFNGENYQARAIRMTVHLEALDLWEAVEQNYEVTSLGDSPTTNQIKHHKEIKTMKAKAKACLFSAVSPSILTIIMQMVCCKFGSISKKNTKEMKSAEYASDDTDLRIWNEENERIRN